MVSPQTASCAVRRGLDTCAGVIIPSLLPFFFASNIISALSLPELLACKASRLMNRLFALPGQASAPLILGLCGGYPIGAASLADAVRRGQLSAKEASRLLPVVNNTGPAFIVGTAGSAVFGSAKIGALLYLSHVVAVFLATVFIFREKNTVFVQKMPVLDDFKLSEIIPESVRKSVISVINICGFVVFFSIISGFLDNFGILGYLSARISHIFGFDMHFCESYLLGILELGSGIASMSGLFPSPKNLALASFLLGFGSFSVHCQTLAVVSGTNIKCARHFAGRILHGSLSAVFTYTLSLLLKI